MQQYINSNAAETVDLAEPGAASRLTGDRLNWPVIKSFSKKHGPEYLITDRKLTEILSDKRWVEELKLTLKANGQIATEREDGGKLRYSVKRAIPRVKPRLQCVAIKAAAIDGDFQTEISDPN